MPARSGDCTSVRNRASKSAGSAVRTDVAALARRALKVKSSILAFTLSAWWDASDRGRGRAAGVAIVLILVLFDESLHADRIPLAVPVAADRTGAAARLDQHIRQEHAGVDLDGRDVRHVNRF